MLDIFLTRYDPIAYPIKQWSKWDYIKRVTLRELNRVTYYYHTKSRFTNNTHILSRLVRMLRTDVNIDLTSYFKSVDISSEYIARQFGFVSNKSKGLVLNNIFYKNENVIINYVNNDFNIFDIKNNYTNLSPIRVIYSNDYVIDYYQFDNSKTNTFKTLTIIELDVNLMLIMYKFWALDRIKKEDSINPNYFIPQVILPNMVKTYLDIAVFNRLLNLFYKIDMSEQQIISHPFHVIDLHRQIDTVLSDVIDKIENKTITIEQLLLTIPTFINNNMIDTLFINRPFYTRQSEWAIWVARLKYTCFLLDILGDRGIARNTSMLNKLPAKIRMLKNRSTDIITQLPNELYSEVKTYLDKIENRLGRR